MHVVAFDGKALKGSFDNFNDVKAKQVLSAFADERHFQHPQGSASAKYTGWRYERVAFFHLILKALFSCGRWTLMKVRMPRYELAPAHNRENGKQQDMRQLVKFAFGAPRIGDCCELREEMFE